MSQDHKTIHGLLKALNQFKEGLEKDIEYTKTLPGTEADAVHLTGYLKAISGILDQYSGLRDIYIAPLDQTTGTYPNHIMWDVRENLGLSPDDTSLDAEIMQMSRARVLDRVMEWDGLIGYGSKVRNWIQGVYGLDLNDLPQRSRPEMEHPLAADITSGKWRANFIAPGERCGRSGKSELINDFKEPVVEFFDMSQDPFRFPTGQFVSSYFASTLLGEDNLMFATDYRTCGLGLCLDPDVPGWEIPPSSMKEIADWIGKKMGQYEREKSGQSLNDLLVSAENRASAQQKSPSSNRDSRDRD